MSRSGPGSDGAGTRRPVVFAMPVRVAPADIDELGHVNNVVYLRWVQEVATAHWLAEAGADLVAAVKWVVLRHEIDYRRPALASDELLARTWVGGASGTRFERHVEIVRASDGVALAQARTVWCPVDAHTGRLKRLDPSVNDRFREPAVIDDARGDAPRG